LGHLVPTIQENRGMCRPHAPVLVRGTLLTDIKHRDFRDRPDVVRASYFELHHRDCIRGTAYNTEATTDTLLLVDNHIGPAYPVFCPYMHWITFDHARETLHTDAVVRTNIHATRTENTDRWVNHDIQLALETTARLLDSLLRCVPGLCLARVAVAVLQRQTWNILVAN